MPEIAGYRVSRVVGTGGMSTVYLGTQLSLGREVAIKVMLPEALADEVSRRRFENEARTIARLEHPHIVGIHEVGRTADGLPWYAMPHLPRGHVGQRRLTGDPQRVREILRALLSALAFAHARGVIHRDVKAENVLFDEADRPLLADFGIALRRGHGTRVTMTGLAVGSTAYMAPEQARGQQVDHRADLYSVGVLAWEMLTGELPYKADDALAMAIQHAQSPLPKLPPGLRQWQSFMDRALAKSPRKRFPDATQMLAALERVPLSGGSHGARLQDFAYGAAARLQRLPKPAWVAVGLVCAAAIGLGMPWRHLAEDVADGEAAPASSASSPTDASSVSAAAMAPGNGGIADGGAATMHGAAPLSVADQAIERARERMRTGRLATPNGESALDSLLEAVRAEAGHPQLAVASTALLDALGESATGAIVAGRDAEATHLLQAAARVQEAASPSASARANHRARVDKALRARIAIASRRVNRTDALRLVEHARVAGLPDATVQQLRAQAERIPDLQGRDPGNLDGMVVLDGATRPLAAFVSPVSRAGYARFAEVTGREPALCRERISLLRVLDRRDWTTPGFEQGGGDPVVCVSWKDAEAYAQWLGQRDGYRYRLPTTAEAASLAAAGGARIVSEWRADCTANCSRRTVAGASWRTDSASRTLDPDRGYDDVGFRLVREL
ncbi:bifunctional serine/threonine-protein kinase/formylglycine-generating enzyme family protein [Luteimonas saliphila]|uniref:bifunctional serine/threonine-protein kinase/formylglycine-generating enzyme family protein n=1 Tax=Luteimonas saliphila TaxID=2804919 RepID=UPI001EE2DEC9|nr:bifunctional serine/threonine-protein kinase/formylglycine-generating enzyme family protein [Luteimonas saliphila]